jgi:hypothetical protein
LRRRRSIVAVTFLAATSWTPRLVLATEGVPVELSFEGCPESLRPEVERIARLELHATSTSPGVATPIGLACSEDEVHITVDDPITGKRVDRTVSLSGVEARDRARLLALAIAELVRSSWLELEARRPAPLPLAKPKPVSVEQRERARAMVSTEHRSPWRASAALDLLYIPTVKGPILGLALGVQRDVTSRWFTELGASAWDGATERKTGLIAIRSIAADPSFGVRLDVVDLAVGLRVGWASLSGSPSSGAFRGNTTSGGVIGPLGTASVRVVGPLAIWLKLGVLLRGQNGVVTEDSDVTMGGFFGSAGLGLRVGP